MTRVIVAGEDHLHFHAVPKRLGDTNFIRVVGEGKIKANNVGKGWRIVESELYRFLKGGYGSFKITAIQRKE